MQYIQRNDEIPFDKNSIITIGIFDGVHLAHQKIIHEVVSLSKEKKFRSIVVTFDPHPSVILGDYGEEIKLLTTVQERQELCKQLGVDLFLVMEFDHTLSHISFRDFYVDYLIGKVGISTIVEGYNHHWGQNRGGDIDALKRLGTEFNFDVVEIDPVMYEGKLLNSTIIRNELTAGSIERVNILLGRPYSLSGKVIMGDRRGHLLGFPTANVELNDSQKLIPKNGIYFVKVSTAGHIYYGMTNIGTRPTFKDQGQRTIEVHLLDFEQDIYGYDLKIYFLRRLRDELKYGSAEQLVQQMNRDEELSRKLQSEYQSII